ncbi:MAG: hypothetical protein K0Q91_660 [Fibrobacteria bacterium]|jgi:hypothetical protein|nr:hypothetical protein [Fibrobacteria bacterium]
MKLPISRLPFALALVLSVFAGSATAHHADPTPEKAPWYLPPGVPHPSAPSDR